MSSQQITSQKITPQKTKAQKMATPKSLLLLLSLSMIAALVACSSSGSSSGGGGGGGTTPSISLSTNPSPVPSSLVAGTGTLSLTATVTNDSKNGGVTWSAACGSTTAGACGTFSVNSSASGTPVTYTAPSAVPSSTVVITATVVDDTSISASTPAIAITATTITVSLSTPPPSSLVAGNTTILAATTNDPTGVNWSCTPTPACGGFSPAQTGTGATTTFTAGVTTGNIVITATAVTDSGQSASATVTITPGAGLADGSYVFYLSGEDTFTDADYFVAGTIKVSGGAITGGEQDFVDSPNFALSDLINPTGSSIGTTSDGNFQIVLNTCDGTNCGASDTNLGVAGVETFNGSLFSATSGLITEFDSSATSTGTLDFQNPTAAAATPSGSYAFTIRGFDGSGFYLALGGILNIDGVGAISGAGSLYDANDGGTTYAAQTFAASTVSAPDSLGRVVFTLNPTDSTDFPPIVLVGYIMDSTHIRLVETTDTYLGTTGGLAFGQTGNPSSVANTYVLGLSGVDSNGFLQAATLLTTNSDGSVSGTLNYNDLTGTGIQSPITIQPGATYATNSVPGYVSISGFTDGVNTYNIQLYLDGNGNALALTLDGLDEMSGRGAQQTGVGSFTASAFEGAYAMQVAGWDGNEAGELSAIGTASADGVGTFAANSDVDLNWLFTPTIGNTVTGTFSANTNGVFTGTITGLDQINGNSQADAFSYYFISPNSVVVIETDPNQLTLGQFRLQ